MSWTARWLEWRRRIRCTIATTAMHLALCVNFCQPFQTFSLSGAMECTDITIRITRCLQASWQHGNVSGWHFDLWNLNVDSDYLEAGPTLSSKELVALEKSQPLVSPAV